MLIHNAHGVQVIDNRYGLTLVSTGNRGTGPFPGDTVARVTGNPR